MRGKGEEGYALMHEHSWMAKPPVLAQARSGTQGYSVADMNDKVYNACYMGILGLVRCV